MSKRFSDCHALRGLLEQALAEYGPPEAQASIPLALCWPKIMGERIARMTQVKCIKEKTLHLVAYSSAWQQEILFLTPQMLTQIHKHFPHLRIHHIRVTAGSLPPQKPTPPSPLKKHISPKQAAQKAEKMVHHLKDTELKQAFHVLLQKHFSTLP
jgi:predicted nucleic acid-binding Zn ribbon protein